MKLSFLWVEVGYSVLKLNQNCSIQCKCKVCLLVDTCRCSTMHVRKKILFKICCESDIKILLKYGRQNKSNQFIINR